MVYGRASQKLLRVRGLRCNPSQTQLDFVCYSAVLDVFVLCRHIMKFGTLCELVCGFFFGNCYSTLHQKESLFDSCSQLTTLWQ